MAPSPAIPWLLDAETPSIRYQTLTRLLELPSDHPDVVQAWQQVKQQGPVPEILACQSAEGSWTGERSYYTPKYTSTHWSMMLLSELTAGGPEKLEGMQRGAKYMLGKTVEEVERNLAKKTWVIECLWGNVLRYAAESGLEDDPRTAVLARYLIASAREGGWTCPINNGLPCAWGAARALWGLAAIRGRTQFPGTEEAIESGIHFLLEAHHLELGDHPTPRGKISPLWGGLSFPLFYQADILFVLRVLGELGRLDHPGARPALAWLEGKRAANGRFPGASPFRRRTHAALGSPEETRRWITLQATMVLKQAGV